MEQQPPQAILGKYGGGTQGNPKQKIGQADLPQKVHGQIGIVPDIQTQPSVYDQSGDQLQCRHYSSAENGLCGHRCGMVPIHPADEPEAKAAQQEHGDMAPAPPQQFDENIKSAACGGNQQFLPDHCTSPGIVFPVWQIIPA